MNTERFQSTRDTANILEFKARCYFKTRDSIAFDLEHPDANGTFLRVGMLTVHHPCQDDIKVRVMASLRKSYRETYKFKSQLFVEAVFELLDIPKNETYQTYFVYGGCNVSTNHYWRD